MVVTAGADRKELEKKYAVVRTVITVHWPFLSAAALCLAHRWSDKCPTMAVDAKGRLYLNPEYFGTLDVGTAALLIAGHELQHYLLDHANRLTRFRDVFLVGGDGERVSAANFFHDLAINSNLKAFADSGAAWRRAQGGAAMKFEVPREALHPSQFKGPDGKPVPGGLISEEYPAYFEHLPKLPQANAAGCAQCGSGAGGPRREWEDGSEVDPDDPASGVSEADAELLRRQVARAAREQESQSRGTVPLLVRQWVEAFLRPPKYDWKRELRREVREAVGWAKGQADYTFARRNRRQQGRVILPGFRAPLPSVCVVLDRSGSMGKSDDDVGFSELAGILRDSGLPKVPVLCCDADADEVQYVRSLSELKLTGGGGTDMRVGIAAAVAKAKARVIVCITDTVTPWPDAPPAMTKVVVVATRPREQVTPPPDWMKTVYVG